MASKTLKKPFLEMLTANLKHQSSNAMSSKKFQLPQISAQKTAPVVKKDEKPADDGEETISIVDINDKVIGSVKRKNLENKPGIDRFSSVIISNKEGQFYVQKRKSTKKWCPGYWDVTFGGMVRLGETYDENAQREVGEELGITAIELQKSFKYLFETEKSQSWGQAFVGVWDGEIKPQKEEVDSVCLMTKEEIRARLKKGEKFTPDGLEVLNKILKKKEH